MPPMPRHRIRWTHFWNRDVLDSRINCNPRVSRSQAYPSQGCWMTMGLQAGYMLRIHLLLYTQAGEVIPGLADVSPSSRPERSGEPGPRKAGSSYRVTTVLPSRPRIAASLRDACPGRPSVVSIPSESRGSESLPLWVIVLQVEKRGVAARARRGGRCAAENAAGTGFLQGIFFSIIVRRRFSMGPIEIVKTTH